MRFRTFAWMCAVIAVVAGNTAIVVWLQSDRAAVVSRGRGGAGWSPARVEESPVLCRPVDAAALGRATLDGARLRVAVSTVAGAPILGAAVRVTGDCPGTWSPFPVEEFAEGTTGEDGSVEFDLPRRASVRVAVRRDGFAPAEVRGAAPLLRVALRPEATLFFRVVDDATEAPRSGLQVRARNRVPVHERPAPEAEGTTLEDGTCRIRGLRPGAWSISVAETGWHLGDVDATEPTVPPVELRLRRPFTLRGRVVVPGFDRFVAEGSVAMGHGAPVLRGLASDGTIPATIGADGRFALLLDGPPKSPYFMRVETGGQAYRVQGQTPAVDPGTGEQVGEIQVPLPGNNPDIAFSGTVRDESGRPVQGALVLLGSGLPFQAVRWMRSEISLDEAWTDAAGAWRALPRYSPTVYREALVLHPHFAPRLVEIPTRMRRKVVDAVLERGVTAIVTVRDAAGRPVVGAEVAAKMAHSDPEKAWQHFGGVQGAICAWPRTGEDGVAALEHLGTGHWYLSARSADGREGATVLAEVRSSGKDFAVDLRLAPLPVVRGTVRVRGGSLPAGATLLVPGETLLSFVRVPIDGSGMFESPPLDIPACFLVDGKIPIFEPEIAGPGRVLALAEPGVPVEIVVDPPPAAPQAR